MPASDQWKSMEAARAFRAWSVAEPMCASFVSSMGSAMVNIIVKSKSKRVKKDSTATLREKGLSGRYSRVETNRVPLYLKINCPANFLSTLYSSS